MSDPIILPPEDYWKLNAYQKDVALAKVRVATAERKVVGLLVALSKTHPGLDLAAAYTSDDERCALIPTGGDDGGTPRPARRVRKAPKVKGV